MAKQIEQLLDKIEQLTTPGSERVRKSSHDCVTDAYKYLLYLKNKHCKKKYNEEHLIKSCFTPEKRFNTTGQISAYCKVHLTMGVNMFEELYHSVLKEKGKFDVLMLRMYEPMLRDFLFDLKEIVEFLEKKNNKNYVFFSGGKNYHATTFEIFGDTRKLIYQSSSKNGVRLDNKVSHISSVLCLRQALELKFQRIVGVIFLNKVGQTAKLRHDFYYNFIKNNQQYFDFPYIDFELIIPIYIWCNEIVHKAYQPYIWQNLYAEKFCRGLFKGGPMNQRGGSTIWGNTRVRNNSEMQERFAEHFSSEYNHNIWCIQPISQEAVTNYYDN